MLLDQAPQRGPEAEGAVVVDAAVLDEQAVEQAAVALLVPAQVVVERLPAQRPGIRQLEGKERLDLLAEPGQAAVGQQVLEASRVDKTSIRGAGRLGAHPLVDGLEIDADPANDDRTRHMHHSSTAVAGPPVLPDWSHAPG